MTLAANDLQLLFGRGMVSEQSEFLYPSLSLSVSVSLSPLSLPLLQTFLMTRDVSDSMVVSSRLGTLESLLPELLESILGLLDVPSLCTARLVCTAFSAAASTFIHTLR